MGSLRTLLKNTTSNAFAGYFGLGVNFVLTIFLARYFGADGFGIFTTATTFAFFGTILTDFGIEAVIVRNVSRNKSDLSLYYVNGLFLTLATALISWMGIGLVVQFLNYSAYFKTIVLIATTTLFFSALSTVSASIIKALEKMELLFIVSTISGVCYSLIGVFIVVFGYGLVVFIVWGVLIDIFNGIALFLIIKKIKKSAFSWKVQPLFCFHILKQSAPVGLLKALNILTNKVDILMLSAMIGNAAVGFYAIAVKIVNFLLIPSGSFNDAFFPHFSARVSSSREEIYRVYHEMVRVLILLSFPIVIIIHALAEVVIKLFFGQPFVDQGSADALKILIWSFFFDVISGPARMVIISLEHKLMKFLWMVGTLALFNVTLNLFMIPAFGIIGTSFSTLVCSLTRFIVLMYVVYKEMKTEMKSLKLFIKPSIAAALLYTVLLISKEQQRVVGIAMGILIYFITLFLLQAIRSEDLSMIRKMGFAGAGKLFKFNESKKD